jgi:peptidyl-prolyl cis-trans isomerase A (cyclophilin A)
MKNQLLASILAFVFACLPAAKAYAQITDLVCLDTTLGEICLKLYPEDASLTVANFRKYVTDGDFNGSIIHRSVPGFVIQGGGYKFSNASGMSEIPKDPAVLNEPRRSNRRGTIAMAKFAGDPNSATSEWFINLGDNSSNLDFSNGGFTVFGEVVIGMNVVDAIASQAVLDLRSRYGDAFSEVPQLGFDSTITIDDFVVINRAYETQRDLTPVPTPENPYPGITTTVTYGSVAFVSDVKWPDGNLYRMFFLQDATPPPNYTFTIDLTTIVLLTDKGRSRATFDGEFLTIPTVRSNPNIFFNVRLRLVDRTTLKFTLVSYERYDGTQTLPP